MRRHIGTSNLHFDAFFPGEYFFVIFVSRRGPKSNCCLDIIYSERHIAFNMYRMCDYSLQLLIHLTLFIPQLS